MGLMDLEEDSLRGKERFSSHLIKIMFIAYMCVSDPLQPYGLCSPPGSSVHGILQAGILEWVAIPSSRGSSWPRNQIWVPHTVGRFFTDGAAAAKSLHSCPTLCDPHRWQPTRLPCPWDSPGKNTGVGCHFLLQCMKVKRESDYNVRLISTV